MKYQVIVKTDLKDRPEDHELSAALILAAHFKTDVVFLRPESRKTPDIDIDGTKWEIKSPRGNSKKTIENNLRTARKQSHNLVVDLRRVKLHQQQVTSRMGFFLSGPHRFKKVLVITKTEKVIEVLP
jgi:hypothetical protein